MQFFRFHVAVCKPISVENRLITCNKKLRNHTGFLPGFYRHQQAQTQLELKKREKLTLPKLVSQIKTGKTDIINFGYLNEH